MDESPVLYIVIFIYRLNAFKHRQSHTEKTHRGTFSHHHDLFESAANSNGPCSIYYFESQGIFFWVEVSKSIQTTQTRHSLILGDKTLQLLKIHIFFKKN